MNLKEAKEKGKLEQFIREHEKFRHLALRPHKWRWIREGVQLWRRTPGK